MATSDDKTTNNESSPQPHNDNMLDDEFSLEAQKAPLSAALPKKETSRKSSPGSNNKGQPAEVLSYRYDDKRTNNPHVGMVDTYSDGVEAQKTWQYDPHIDPALNFDSSRSTVENLIDDALASGDKDQMQVALEQLKRMQSPYLAWAGKAERTSFAVDTVSLHVHERIDPATILAAVQKKLKDGKGKSGAAIQPDLFHAPFENLPLREAIDFYKHERDWSNRLITGDSLLVMNSLLQKEGMAGQVQMIYIDPPYGIKYGSNFQPFVNKRDVKDRKDEDLTQEPEMIKAFRDTWELGIHSYLTYLRDRLLLAKELLHESGSVFVQISDENIHIVRNLLDEIFGNVNFVSLITFRKKAMQFGARYVEGMSDYLLFYAKNVDHLKFRSLHVPQTVEGYPNWIHVQFVDGSERKLTGDEWQNHSLLRGRARVFRAVLMRPSGHSDRMVYDVPFRGQLYKPANGGCWSTTEPGMYNLLKASRVFGAGENLYYKLFYDDYPVSSLTNLWADMSGQKNMIYAVQTLDENVPDCTSQTTGSNFSLPPLSH